MSFSHSSHPEHPAPARITLQTLVRMARAAEPFACLTCYDASTAKWLARGGVHVLLVGDTAAEMVLGLQRTIDMPLDVLIALTAGVKRGAPNCVVMGDMPFMSYQTDDATAIRNAGQFLTEGMADIVKIEADARLAERVSKIVHAGIPVCGHVGSRPQYVALTGGYAAAGRTVESAKQVVDDAVALEQAGCAMLLVEAVPPEVADRIAASTTVPLIGSGAGTGCHGQVLVLQDLVGMTDQPPRFAEAVASLGQGFQQAAAEWVARVARREIGGKQYTMKPTVSPSAAKVAGARADGSPSQVRPNDGHATSAGLAGSS